MIHVLREILPARCPRAVSIASQRCGVSRRLERAGCESFNNAAFMVPVGAIMAPESRTFKERKSSAREPVRYLSGCGKLASGTPAAGRVGTYRSTSIGRLPTNHEGSGNSPLLMPISSFPALPPSSVQSASA